MITEFYSTHKLFSFLLLLWILCSVITWVLYIVDKRRSIKDSQRISEKTLLLWSVVGSFGAILGIYCVRHKTLHIYFPIIAIESLLLEGVLLYAIY